MSQSFDMSIVKEVKWHDKGQTFNVCDLQIDGVSIWKCNTGGNYYLKNGDAGGPIVSTKTGVEKTVSEVMEGRQYGLRVVTIFYVRKEDGNPYWRCTNGGCQNGTWLPWQLGRTELQRYIESDPTYIPLRNRLVSELNREILSTRLQVLPYPYGKAWQPYYTSDPDQDPWLNW